MKWQHKARIMRVCARLPQGDKVYKIIQKTFGRLDANPMSRIPHQIEMARWLLGHGKKIEGSTFFEVGTGHKPIVPIGFYLSGVSEFITVDLNRRLDLDLTREVLCWIAHNRDMLAAIYQEIADTSVFQQRMNMVQKYRGDPLGFFREAKVHYLAPADAARTNQVAESIDCHLSVTTLEHIPRQAIRDIFVEARRILANDGVALHFVDPSDHFQHQDASISKINFLRFGDEEWIRIAGNEFAYCNRLRVSDYVQIFEELGFAVARVESEIDQAAVNAVEKGFPLDSGFRKYEVNDLCSTEFRVMMQRREDSPLTSSTGF
jgi:hypothetical protein